MSSSTAIVWLELIACAFFIGMAGARLSRYAGVIADKTGFSGNRIGLSLFTFYLLNSCVL